MTFTRTLPLLAVMIFSAGAPAAEMSGVFKFVIDLGGSSFGVSPPSGQQVDRVQMGHGFGFGKGISILNEAKTLQGEFTLSWFHSDHSNCDNSRNSNCPPPLPDDWNWDRFPIDALVFYRWSKIRLGGGLTYDLYSKFDSGGAASGLNFKAEPGARLEFDWRVIGYVNLGIRYTRQYFREVGSGTKLDGSGVGIVLTFVR